MNFDEWYEQGTDMAEDIYKNTAEYMECEKAWNAATDEAIKVVSVVDCEGFKMHPRFIDQLEELKE